MQSKSKVVGRIVSWYLRDDRSGKGWDITPEAAARWLRYKRLTTETAPKVTKMGFLELHRLGG